VSAKIFDDPSLTQQLTSTTVYDCTLSLPDQVHYFQNVKLTISNFVKYFIIKYSMHHSVMDNPIHNILYLLITYFRLYAYFRSTLHLLLFLSLLNISRIKYSMYDVIFVRVKQSLSMIFGKYQLQYSYFRSKTSLDHAHFYFYYH